MQHPDPGGTGARDLFGDLLASNDPKLVSTPQKSKPRPALRRRGDYARDAVFEAFGYQHARAIDYDGFIDRKPTPAPVWRRSGS